MHRAETRVELLVQGHVGKPIARIIVVITVIVLGLNMVMDLLYALLNPRIRYS